MPTSTYDLIASEVVTGTPATVTFASIPATYSDLVLVIEFLGSTTNRPLLRFNNVSTSTYNMVRMIGNGTTASSTTAANQTSIDFNNPAGSSTETLLQVYQIMDYAATDKHKTVLARTGRAGSAVSGGAARWASTDAINEIDINVSSGTFAATSTLYLYGIVS